jgi:DNA-binding CsgD family transcriptional regulator
MLDSVSRTENTAPWMADVRQHSRTLALPDALDQFSSCAGSTRLDASEFTEILEELDTGVIVCDGSGQVALANNAARRELLGGWPLAVDSAGQLYLAEGVQAAEKQWQSALRAAALSRRRQMLALCDGPHRLMISVMPLGQQMRRALVMLGRRQPAPDLAVEMLGNLYALTAAEQQVLASLLAGQRVEALASERGVTVATLRSQVGSLREKLGAARLEDLVRLAAGLPPMTSALRSPPLCAGNASPRVCQARTA